MLTVKNRKFYLDGEEFIIHSGTMHYFRVLPEYWEDILLKIKACGFNCVETYTCWNLHEPKKGEYNFSGMLDIERFIETAEKVGLKVLLRVGPYICAEWENGGLPAWLLKDAGIRLRCLSEPYMTHMTDWFSVLLPKIKPHLDSNGGPVIAMAVENEYGSFGDDLEYLDAVEKIYRKEGIDCLLIAADGSTEYFLSTGRNNPEIVQGVDFGVGAGKKEIFDTVTSKDADAPYFAAEYWAGNFTSWGEPECKKENDEIVKEDIKNLTELGASFNIYMLFGGTNFGFTSGVNTISNRFNSFITSYDYDAAITEWGGYTKRYFDIKNALAKVNGYETKELPPSPKFQNIGQIAITESASLFDNLHIGRTYKSKTVENMEHFDQSYGYILYRKVMEYDSPLDYVSMKELHDRALVFLNGELAGIRMRMNDETAVRLPKVLEKGDVLDILVENMGRINYGSETYLGDRKGILGGVFLLDSETLTHAPQLGKCAFNWETTCLELDDISKVKYKQGSETYGPAFFKATFKAKTKDSCFVHLSGFTKGVVFINGFNLGRYWVEGPQTALYLPGALLKDENEIVIFESDGIVRPPLVSLTDKHGLGEKNEEVII